ncbi:hypothetical protein Xcc1_11470 [Xanthomonas campestris pv. campestris]|nr:hypothetical protein Xcc1_11470 [Xanthomonas campestris pv. campestris]
MVFNAALSGFIASAGLIIAIGAQNAFVLRQGLQRRHVGLVVAICAFGDITLILAGVAGIGAVVQHWPQILQLFRYAGAAFLAVYGRWPPNAPGAGRAHWHLPNATISAGSRRR